MNTQKLSVLIKTSPNTTTVTNVTQGVTTSFQYFTSGGLYTALQSSINGRTVTLTNYYHSVGVVTLDKWHGQVDGYDVDATISGKPNVSWKFEGVDVIVP